MFCPYNNEIQKSMSKKCVHCGAPIEGFWAKISSLAGVKQSAKNPDYCNKCEGMIPAAPEAPQPVQPTEAPVETDKVE